LIKYQKTIFFYAGFLAFLPSFLIEPNYYGFFLLPCFWFLFFFSTIGVGYFLAAQHLTGPKFFSRMYLRMIYHLEKRNLLNQEVQGVAWEIAVGILALLGFSAIWAIFYYEVYPNLQSFQTTNFPVGVFDPNQTAFLNQLIIWFPLICAFSVFWFWLNRSQKKSDAGDLPG
jgi:hypothetical protein